MQWLAGCIRSSRYANEVALQQFLYGVIAVNPSYFFNLRFGNRLGIGNNTQAFECCCAEFSLGALLQQGADGFVVQGFGEELIAPATLHYFKHKRVAFILAGYSIHLLLDGLHADLFSGISKQNRLQLRQRNGLLGAEYQGFQNLLQTIHGVKLMKGREEFVGCRLWVISCR